VDEVRERRPVKQLVEAVKDQWTPKDVRDEQRQPQEHGHLESLPPDGTGVEEPPRARRKDEEKAGVEQRLFQACVTLASQRVTGALESEAETHQHRYKPEPGRA
jgi:hypothetical protein